MDPEDLKEIIRTKLKEVGVTPQLIVGLAHEDPDERGFAAFDLFKAGLARSFDAMQVWEQDPDLKQLIVGDKLENGPPGVPSVARITVGIAVFPETFRAIRKANGSPPLADAPADQEVLEFELEFSEGGPPQIRLDILTTTAPDGNTAIARFLDKFGEGVQQVELDVTDVDRATEIVRTRFNVSPVYPAARPGANGTRVNFFLVKSRDGQKVLIEFVEQPK